MTPKSLSGHLEKRQDRQDQRYIRIFLPIPWQASDPSPRDQEVHSPRDPRSIVQTFSQESLNYFLPLGLPRPLGHQPIATSFVCHILHNNAGYDEMMVLAYGLALFPLDFSKKINSFFPPRLIHFGFLQCQCHIVTETRQMQLNLGSTLLTSAVGSTRAIWWTSHSGGAGLTFIMMTNLTVAILVS